MATEFTATLRCNDSFNIAIGAGTILQALRMRNKKLIIVVNMSLMDNHQYQLAQAMQSNNYAICSDIR
jgi:beta-1,4-N-acetylglucosaminyltransferase